jgi:hypothetical protein
MNCKELNIEPACWWCNHKNSLSYDCLTNRFCNSFKIFDAIDFNRIIDYYIKVSEENKKYFLVALQFTNSQWHERLLKLIVLK